MKNKAEEGKAKKRSKNKSQSQKIHRTRIVAIGASAGGLEPFESFFDAMPIESGLAFVIIQHLSPDFKSMMNELLARHSGMRICHVQDGMRVEPNTIYLNVPRTNLTIKNGCFELVDSSAHAALNHPINAFFKSLAEEMGDRAIGVILSGTGSDGTDGCRAIKEAGGTVFVQSPESAKFDGMPMWVIDAKLADAIATPHKLPAKILTYLATGQLDRDEEKALSAPPLTQILNIVHERIGTDFSDYKLSTVERRIRRRAEMTGEPDLAKYINRLNEDSGEIDALYNDLLIEVTTFFRDKEAFKRLEFDIIPRIAIL